MTKGGSFANYDELKITRTYALKILKFLPTNWSGWSAHRPTGGQLPWSVACGRQMANGTNRNTATHYPLHYTHLTLHYTHLTLHYSHRTLHSTGQHYIANHCTALHISLHCTELHNTKLLLTTPHYSSPHYRAPHYTAVHLTGA